HLRVFINNSITGSLVVPPEVVSLEVRDSILDTSRKEGRALVVPALVSGAVAPFPAVASPNPALRITIGDEGPIMIHLGGVPANRVQAGAMLEAAIRAASTSPGFANAQVLSNKQQFFILSGDRGQVSFQAAPGDDTAEKWLLLPAAARAAVGLLSGPLTAPIALTSAAPALYLVIGTIGPKKVDLAGFPTTLNAARQALETAIRAADASDEFAGARVFLIGDRFLILPGGEGAAVSVV